MTAKERLQQIRKLNACIDSKQRIVDRLRAQAQHMSPSTVGVGASDGGKDDLVRIVAKICGMLDDINDKIDELVDKKMIIEKQIDLLPNGDSKVILERRYIADERWEDIAEAMKLELRWVHRLHGRALQEFEKLTMKSH